MSLKDSIGCSTITADFTRDAWFGRLETWGVPTMEDVKDGEKMSLEFADKHTIWVYFMCDNIDKIKKDRSLLKSIRLYESPNVAKATNLSGSVNTWQLVKCHLDISNCLDLLNFNDIVTLRKYYDSPVKNKVLKKNITDAELVTSYIQVSHPKVIREVVERKDIEGKSYKIHSGSNIKAMYIKYVVLDISCLGNIKIVQ